MDGRIETKGFDMVRLHEVFWNELIAIDVHVHYKLLNHAIWTEVQALWHFVAKWWNMTG